MPIARAFADEAALKARAQTVRKGALVQHALWIRLRNSRAILEVAIERVTGRATGAGEGNRTLVCSLGSSRRGFDERHAGSMSPDIVGGADGGPASLLAG